MVDRKNKNGETVVRSACGTKLNCIGYSFISPEEGITETNIWTWPNKISAPELPGGEIGGKYADPYGQGRITVIDR